MYQFFLNRFDEKALEVDTITEMVARQTEQIIQFLGYQSFTLPHQTQNSIQLYVENKFVARVVEGCNAISVIILFIAFVVAFKGSFKKTLFFVFIGSVLIYGLNVFRIAVIAIALYHYPQYEHMLHGVVFPLLIYGVVFLLWVIWVNKYSIYGQKK
jgi:exosortase family protein XrtF